MISNFEKSLFKTQKEYALDRLQELSYTADVPDFIDWATENRYLPPGSSDFYGAFDKSIAPHLIEPLNRCHPEAGFNQIALMKSVQSLVTTTVLENAIGAYIKYKLGSILSLTSNQTVAKIRSSSTIDVLIDHAGLDVKPMSGRMGKKTADTAIYKEFAGGIKLLMSSYNSIGNLKSNTFHFIAGDEWDEAKAELKDQGDIKGIMEGRTMGVQDFLILLISTPSRMETSRIYKAYLEGDQRKYNVPCPLCGEKQVLVLKYGEIDHGLTFTMEKNKKSGVRVLVPDTVRYKCKHCKEDFYETKKQWMLENGVWIPTADPVDRKKTSYHIPGLLSPEMFLSWERISQKFINTKFGKDLLMFKDFKINYLGLPWASVKKKPSWEKIKLQSENYCFGEVPEGFEKIIDGVTVYMGGLILTAGVDIQGDRIEMMVVAHGPNSEKWIVDYQIFFGKTDKLDSSSWVALDQWLYTHSYKICGKEYYIIRAAIDSGWDPKKSKNVNRDKDYTGKSHTVYEFVASRTDVCMAIMGVANEDTSVIISESRIKDINTNLAKKYNVSVSLLKELFFEIIDQKEGHGTIHVPGYRRVRDEKREIEDEWYKQLASEQYQEISPGVMGWKKIHERNEPLDCFNYAVAAGEFEQISRYNLDSWGIYYHNIKSND